jgi:hypothetical protein
VKEKCYSYLFCLLFNVTERRRHTSIERQQLHYPINAPNRKRKKIKNGEINALSSIELFKHEVEETETGNKIRLIA